VYGEKTYRWTLCERDARSTRATTMILADEEVCFCRDDVSALLATAGIVGMLSLCDGDTDRIWLYGCLNKIAAINPKTIGMWLVAAALSALFRWAHPLWFLLVGATC
jgi:hypothetical protein